MEFKKYDQRGAYHWELYENKRDIYHHYVNNVLSWLIERPVLDVGAGDGLITHLFGTKSIGFDNKKTAVNLAKAKNANVVHGDVYKPLILTKYPAVFMGDVIEHLADWKLAIKNIKSCLNDDGHLYITTPPARADRKLQDKFHYFEWNPDELKLNIESQGFECVDPIIVQNYRMFAKFKINLKP